MTTGASLVLSNFRYFRDMRMPLAHRHKISDFQQACVLAIPTKPVKGISWNVSRKSRFKEVESGDIDTSKKNSDSYSAEMTEAMGAVLTYRHDLGMNYNFVLPDLIVGSCLQIPDDVDRLKNLGVQTIFCLQQNPDLEYFGVDIRAIYDRAIGIEGIEHIRAPIRDFDAYDLRIRLPSVIAKLHNAAKRNGGITYIHCTAGLGRAPAVAITYMYWLLGYGLDEANEKVQAVRPCFPKLDAIKNATCDLFTGGAKETVVLQWQKSYSQSVEISGLDVGWGQRIPLVYDPIKSCWTLKCRLPVGRYEYKYIIDGRWTCNPDEPLTEPNGDGHVNNYVEVVSNSADTESNRLRHALMKGDALSDIEREYISEKLKALCND